MNALVKRALAFATPVAIGAGVGAGATVAATNGAHEAITVAIGDSIVPRFSVRTDSILSVVGSRIIPQRCGTSNIYLRTWRGTGQLSAHLSADTIDVTVACPAPPAPAPVASVSVCFLSPAVAKQYRISGDTTVDPKHFPAWMCQPTANLSIAAVRMRAFEARHPRIALVPDTGAFPLSPVFRPLPRSRTR